MEATSGLSSDELFLLLRRGEELELRHVRQVGAGAAAKRRRWLVVADLGHGGKLLVSLAPQDLLLLSLVEEANLIRGHEVVIIVVIIRTPPKLTKVINVAT